MLRKNLKCTVCGSSDFDAEVTLIPSAIRLTCHSCGRVTPIAVYTGNCTNAAPINSSEMLDLLDNSYVGEITPRMIWKADRK